MTASYCISWATGPCRRNIIWLSSWLVKPGSAKLIQTISACSKNPFPSDGPNNPNNKQNLANIWNGSQQQGCNAALPFPKPMPIASSCRSSLKFRKIFHGNDRNNHRNQLHWGGEFNDIELCRHVRPTVSVSVGVKSPVTFPSWGPWPSAGWAASWAYGILEAENGQQKPGVSWTCIQYQVYKRLSIQEWTTWFEDDIVKLTKINHRNW